MPLDKERGHPSANASPPKLKVMDGRARAVDERAFASIADDALVAEALACKGWAQREVWYRFAPMVLGLFRRSLSSRHDHEDLAQEVFIRVFRRLHTLQNASSLRSFVYSIALRVMSEEIRHFQVVQRARTQLVLTADHNGGGADFEARDTLARIQRVLDGMKDKHRAVFVLRHVEGLELLEIADGLGISLATVKRYLVKAMRTIERATAADDELVGRLGFAPYGRLPPEGTA